MRHKGAVEISAAEHQGVAVSPKTYTAAEMPFKQFAMLGGPRQLQPNRRHLAISAALSDSENP